MLKRVIGIDKKLRAYFWFVCISSFNLALFTCSQGHPLWNFLIFKERKKILKIQEMEADCIRYKGCFFTLTYQQKMKHDWNKQRYLRYQICPQAKMEFAWGGTQNSVLRTFFRIIVCLEQHKFQPKLWVDLWFERLDDVE